MTGYVRYGLLIGTLAVLLSGCSLLADIPDLIEEVGEQLPLAPIGGIPIEVVVNVEFDNRTVFGGDELESSEGGWTHTQEGRLLRSSGWLPHHDRIEGARGAGRLICWYDWGQPAGTPHWTVNWSSELTLPEPEQRLHAISGPLPPIHIAIEGADALVIYAPPTEFGYWHPGSVDDCQNPDPVPAHEASGYLVYDLDEVDVQRPPGAEDSADVVIQDGIVLLRVPLDRLRAGASEANTVQLSGVQGDPSDGVEWGLTIRLSLTSSAGEL